MLRTRARKERDRLARGADDADPGRHLADRAPVVERLEHDVVREDDEEDEHEHARERRTRAHP